MSKTPVEDDTQREEKPRDQMPRNKTLNKETGETRVHVGEAGKFVKETVEFVPTVATASRAESKILDALQSRMEAFKDSKGGRKVVQSKRERKREISESFNVKDRLKRLKGVQSAEGTSFHVVNADNDIDDGYLKHMKMVQGENCLNPQPYQLQTSKTELKEVKILENMLRNKTEQVRALLQRSKTELDTIKILKNSLEDERQRANYLQEKLQRKMKQLQYVDRLEKSLEVEKQHAIRLVKTLEESKRELPDIESQEKKLEDQKERVNRRAKELVRGKTELHQVQILEDSWKEEKRYENWLEKGLLRSKMKLENVKNLEELLCRQSDCVDFLSEEIQSTKRSLLDR